MVTTLLCLCWKEVQMLLVSVPKAHLEPGPKLVPHLLPWKLQQKHEGAFCRPPSKVIFILPEPCKVSVQWALKQRGCLAASKLRGTRYLHLTLLLWHHCHQVSSPGHKAYLCWPDCRADASAEALALLPLRFLNFQMPFRASHKHQTPFLPTTLDWMSTLCSQTSCHLLPLPHHRDFPHLLLSGPATCKIMLEGLHRVARQSQRSFGSSSLLAPNHQHLSKTQGSVPLPC